MFHQKHPPIARRQLGRFAKLEFALVGTTCERIDGYLNDLYTALHDNWRVLTVTGDHGRPEVGTTLQSGAKKMRAAGEWSELDDRLIGSGYDLALVNGNHYPASRQLVFIDPSKAGTLERRRDQLTDVAAIVVDTDGSDIPGWLTEDHPNATPIWNAAEFLAHVTSHLLGKLRAAEPDVKALILAGGKSTRMGKDKAGLIYQNGEPEAQRLARLCRERGLETYFSVSEASNRKDDIVDRFVGLGPLGAIASAFLFDPESAWLVLACDLPLLGDNLIQRLLEERDARCVATAVHGAGQTFPEPLIALYEPRAYGRMLQFLSIGYACPRKVLINSEVREVVLEDEAALTNANTPEERARVLDLLAKR